MTFLHRLSALGPWPITALMVAAYAGAAFLYYGGGLSGDLTALYLAGHAFARGDLAGIYAPPGAFFDLRVPDGWEVLADRLGATGRPLFPYIYPPLWAALAAPLTDLVPVAAVHRAASLVNPLLLGFSAILAHRIVRPRMALPLFVALGLALVTVTSFGDTALLQNQPQILVGFLILAAIERDRGRAPLAAGALLALAASIKLYPALFAIAWIATRNGRALAGFALAGAVLAGVSVLAAGWPLHAAFLERIALISRSFVLSPLNYSLASLEAHWLLRDFLVASAGDRLRADGQIANLAVAAKPAIFVLADRLVLLAGLALLYLGFARAGRETRYRRLYPAAIIFVALASPLTWSYHYLPVAFLLPILTELYPRRAGWWLLAGTALIYCQPLNRALESLPTPYFPGQILGTIAMLGLLALFVLAPQPAGPGREPPPS